MNRHPGQRRVLGIAATTVVLLLGVLWLDARGAAAQRSAVDSAVAPSEEIIAIPASGGIKLQTRVRRPQGSGPYALAIVNHGSPPSAAQRPSMEIPSFASAADWLLSKGYMVALPLRRGYGDTGGPWAENYGPCRDPDFYRAGLASADDIGAALQFFRGRSDVKRETILVIGQSAGGWGSVATASRNPSGVVAILNFAGGRGGAQPQVGNCVPQRLVEAAGRYGSTARIRSLWLYSENDKFFAPQLSRSMFDAYVRGGAPAQYVALPAFGDDGHRIFGAAAGRALWQPPVEEFLTKLK
jgi:dienelactone hydrolase